MFFYRSTFYFKVALQYLRLVACFPLYRIFSCYCTKMNENISVTLFQSTKRRESSPFPLRLGNYGVRSFYIKSRLLQFQGKKVCKRERSRMLVHMLMLYFPSSCESRLLCALAGSGTVLRVIQMLFMFLYHHRHYIYCWLKGRDKIGRAHGIP